MDDLRCLQMAELDILKKILAICEKHSITYYMQGGTFLGAVRHQGFIPWDDDVDIGMPRPDYERFIKYATEELEPPYQIHTIQMQNGEYSYYYPRIENSNVKLLRTAAYKTVIIPAWVDVFPLDGVPSDPLKQKKWLRKCRFYQILFNKSQFRYFASAKGKIRDNSLAVNVFNKVFLALRADRLINTQWSWKQFDNALRENDYNSCDTIINFCGYWRLKEMFPKSVYGKGRLYQFEDLMLNGPEDYDFVLRQMYGDYMTPPSDNQRNHHFIELIRE